MFVLASVAHCFYARLGRIRQGLPLTTVGHKDSMMRGSSKMASAKLKPISLLFDPLAA